MDFEFPQWSDGKFQHIAAIPAQTHLFNYYFLMKKQKHMDMSKPIVL